MRKMISSDCQVQNELVTALNSFYELDLQLYTGQYLQEKSNVTTTEILNFKKKTLQKVLMDLQTNLSMFSKGSC